MKCRTIAILPTTENLILLGLIERFMQPYTGYFSSDYSLCAGFSLPMCQERSDDDDDDDGDDDYKSLHFCACFLNVQILYIGDAVQQSGQTVNHSCIKAVLCVHYTQLFLVSFISPITDHFSQKVVKFIPHCFWFFIKVCLNTCYSG